MYPSLQPYVSRAATLCIPGCNPVLLDAQRRAWPPTEEELLAVPWRLLSHMTPFTQQRLVPWEAYTTRPRKRRHGGGGGGGGGVSSPRTLREATREAAEAGGMLLPSVREVSPRGGGGSDRSHAVSRQGQRGAVLLLPRIHG